MADDQQNPFTMLGMMQMMQPNKYLNPANLTGYNGGLGMPDFYTGQDSVGGAGSMPPTDASGKPITSFQDAQTAHDNWTPPAGTTTLNQTQQTPTHPAAAGQAGQPWNYYTNPTGATPGQPYSSPAAVPDSAIPPGETRYSVYASQPDVKYRNVAAQMPSPEAVAQSTMGGGGYSHGPSTDYGNAVGAMAANQNMSDIASWNAQPAAAPAAAAPKNPINMRQVYLDALSRPQGNGRMITPGADVPAASPKALLGQPSVLTAFMDQHPDGGSPAPAGGGYSNAPFFDTLNKLRSA